MKIITPILIFILFFLGSGMLCAYGFFKLTSAVKAEEYSPLDFTYNYKAFEVQVGVSENDGRYYTYHYEF